MIRHVISKMVFLYFVKDLIDKHVTNQKNQICLSILSMYYKQDTISK